MVEKVTGIIPHKSNDLQLNNQATKIFTVGGIDITTNLTSSPKISGTTTSLSKFFDLDNLPATKYKPPTRDPQGGLKVSFDKADPTYFAKYGSLLELVRVSIENIILKFPASIRSSPSLGDTIGYNITNSQYIPLGGTTTFVARTNFFSNPFDIYYGDNLQFEFNDDRVTPLRNLTLQSDKYTLVVDGISYEILEFTPESSTSTGFITLKVKGNPFEGGANSKEFYITPKEKEVNSFYEDLDEFEAYLLNKDNNYAAIFYDKKEKDGGIIINYKLKLQFPKLDDYNIDVTTSKYTVYLNDLKTFAERFDDSRGNLLMRKLVPENVQSITLENNDSLNPTYGQINKLLIIYGRHLDDLNRYLKGAKFFNNVTYDKKNNIPDGLIKNFASSIGWDVKSTDELDIEAWRQLILNSWYIFSSKGTRKSIDFILKFMGVPSEIVEFNEYIIRAKTPINVDQLEHFYENFRGDFDIRSLPIDNQGFPTYPQNTLQDYFQMDGNVDRGMRYFQKWLNLFPESFTGSSVTTTGNTTSIEVLYDNNFNSGQTIGYKLVKPDGTPNECYTSSGQTVEDPHTEEILDVCGCPLPIEDNTLRVDTHLGDLYSGCTPIILDVWYDCIDGETATLNLRALGGTPPYTFTGATDGQIVNTGDTIQVYATDSNGCTSDTIETTIECVDPCLSASFDIDLSYECVTDEFGRNTGDATIILNVSGGTPPYTYLGVQSGDTVSDGQIVTTRITDASGCTSEVVGLTIDCPPHSAVSCDPIQLLSTLETTDSELADKTAKVNVTYDLQQIPQNLFVDNINLSVIGVGGDDVYVVGSPTSQDFTTRNGADTISLDFNPNEIPVSITLEITFTAEFTDGCTYTDTYQLTVNPRLLGNVDEHDNILT